MAVRRSRRAALLLATALLTTIAPAARAQTTPPPGEEPQPKGIALAPKPGTPGVSTSGSHFEFGTVKIGVATRGTLVARNLGDKEETAQLYGADAIPARGGGFGFTPQGETPMDVGAWIKLDTKRITLAPQATATVAFTVVVPTGATAGEHIGGVVLEPVEPVSGGGLKVGTRVAVGVYLTVEGSSTTALQPGLTITKLRAPVRDGQICPTVSYTNSGTAVLDPTAEIAVDPSLGRRTARYPAGKVGGVPPGASLTVELPCVRKVPLGRSRLKVTLGFPGGSAQRDVGVSNWPFSVLAAGSLLLLLLLALLWLLFLAKRRDRDDREDDQRETVAAD